MTLNEIGQQLAELRDQLQKNMPRDVMTPGEAAEMIGVSVETLYRWRKDGFGPAYSQPNHRVVRYLREDVLAFLREHRK